MKNVFSLGFLSALLSLTVSAQSPKPVPEKYRELPLSAIKPTGWLRHQLQIMRDGTTGHLDEIYSKISNDNGWLGGKGDAWEETPYWLDGAVPLAYLLDDKALQQKVAKYVNWVIENQRPSGYFGATTKDEREKNVKIDVANCASGDDWWPKMVMLKVIQQYYSATNDKRVVPFMTKYFHYQLQALKSCPVGKWTEWAASRGADNVMMAQWLYGITGDKSLLELASMIESQSFQWSEWLGNRDWVIGAAAQQNGDHWMRRHAVNVGMALKSPAVNYQRTGDAKFLRSLKTGFNDLMTLHGLPMGIFSGDEDLHGNDPTQGVELCAIVESMFSLEKIIGITGDIQYMDALERMTFNALPTQTTDDYNAKQYFQIANQVHVKRGVFNFSLPFGREMNNVFGMRSGYTCCLANMHQGWTKFATHLWYASPDKGLAALAYSPNEVTAKVGVKQTEVTLRESTTYPFDETIRFDLSTPSDVQFPLHLRIPSWCQKAMVTVNGKSVQTSEGGKIIVLNRLWKNGDKIMLQLPMAVNTSNWGRNSRTVERGPLVYALKLEETWQKENQKEEGDYFTVFPKSDWNYGLLDKIVKDPAANLEVKIGKPVTDTFVWNLQNAPLEIKASAKKIPEWKIVNDVAPQPVTDRDGHFLGKVDDNVETITLVPYGCTKVRVVAFPIVK
ncbi:beta-L-arabinofuranosidase domain-containing protein [Spirosoma oryzicola]|uniref:beta-L-arabinofuranosidase domain-containing protein n=1 Tax=Spirosoma oryzicola TaxID=2898794 RepID=UPI001E5DAD4A|nr:beta-L-arabinofuranosidase domain-containing protein [Spirosoma oryzicola]UHG94112.1 glycoside hydrolase family 127 protein [Spirosoma oryzicola]